MGSTGKYQLSCGKVGAILSQIRVITTRQEKAQFSESGSGSGAGDTMHLVSHAQTQKESYLICTM